MVGEEWRTAARAGALSGAQQQQPLGEVTAARTNTCRAAGTGATAAGMGAGKAGTVGGLGRSGAEGLKRKAPPPNANPFARKKANA